jgi:hypothetical protein
MFLTAGVADDNFISRPIVGVGLKEWLLHRKRRCRDEHRALTPDVP